MAGLCIVDIKPKNENSSYFLGLTRNISHEGFSFESQNYNLSPGDILEFQIKHPDGKGSASVIGEVLWHKETGFECLTGVMMRHSDDAARNDIDRLLTSLQCPRAYTPPMHDRPKVLQKKTVIRDSSPADKVTAGKAADIRSENKKWNGKFLVIPMAVAAIVVAVLFFPVRPGSFKSIVGTDDASLIPPVLNSHDLDREQDTHSPAGTADIQDIEPVESVPAPVENVNKATEILPPVSEQAKKPRTDTIKSADKGEPLPAPAKPVLTKKTLPVTVQSALSGKQRRVPSVQSRPAPPENQPRETRAIDTAMLSQDFTSYKETFDDNSHNWDLFDIGAASASIREGSYIIENRKQEGTLVILHFHEFPHDRDFVVEARITALDNTGNHYYGFVFGARDALNNYSFQIRGDNHYTIRKYSNGAAEDLATGEITNASINHFSPNVLKVFHLSSGMRFYINDHYVAEINQPDLFGNRIGFILEGKSKIAVEETRSWLKDIHGS